MTTSESHLGDLIRQQRIARGWSQEDLAERIANIDGHAIKQPDISRIERGDIALPRFERLSAISRVLDIPVGELILAATRQRGDSACSAGGAAAIPVDDVLINRDTNQLRHTRSKD